MKGFITMAWLDSFRKNIPAVGDPGDSFNNFTPRAQQVLAFARREADLMHHNFVGTEHLLLGLVKLGQGVAVNVLQRMGLDLETVRHEVETQVGSGPDRGPGGHIPYPPRVRRVLALAQEEARSLNHTYVGTEHILLGLLREDGGVAARVLKNLDVNADHARQEILKQLDPNFVPGDDASVVPNPAPSTNPMAAQTCSLDVTKRYDVYCAEKNGGALVVYRNVLFKSRKKLFPAHERDFFAQFLELEQGDGETVFISSYSIMRFCEHGLTSNPENVDDGSR